MNKIIKGDCLEVLKRATPNSVDAIVTDPPYELGFMGKSWDSTGIANNVELWKECLRVLKPGGHLLAFSGTRTYHRMASAIEDAGFEVRDMIEWIYASGFPKSLNIHKKDSRCPEGWGTALKPAHEPICMARKPLAEKTVAENVLKYGTGGLNIDESRVEAGGEITDRVSKGGNKNKSNSLNELKEVIYEGNSQGRFPANLIHDNSEEVRECFPETNKSRSGGSRGNGEAFFGNRSGYERGGIDDNGCNASRFFKSIIYQAKASKSERNKGCEELPIKSAGGLQGRADGSLGGEPVTAHNNHPTVKPIALMEYLIKMITPKGGIVLDPFAGSGSTLVAAKQNGFQYIGIEMTEEYIPIIEARLNAIK